ncbi:MAG TPA: M20/M25/M40 family metallo-hydrolase [Longimicrobiales bacterium]|nr:M20/M25/M40 family metallo-hydrolase [Longimicrobiales bacterium]
MRSLVLAALLAALPPAALAAQTASVPAHGGAAITAEDVAARVAWLASDELAGRETPSPGLEAAAAYAAAEFARFGLQPAGDSGSFVQRYPLQSARMDRERVLFRAGPDVFAYGTQYFVAPSMRGDSTAAAAIYLGNVRPGLALPTEARDRIVVFAIADTLSAATQEAWQEKLVASVVTAMSGGAAGIVLILDPAFSVATIGMLAQFVAGQQAPLPVVGVAHDAIAPLFATAGHDLAALRAADPAAPLVLPGEFVIRTAASAATDLVPNVVALLPGSDPALKDEYIVFTAHIDHVGIGAPDARGDSIYNGADDDASGTAAVLELAQAFAAAPRAPQRSLLFLLVSGEERGLLGSRHFVAEPTVPLAQIVANINADMIGRNHPDTVYAIGGDYTTMGEVVQRVARENPELRLAVAPDPLPEEQLFFRSDHYSFAARDIPALFFTTGLHADYHRASDEAEHIDADKLARITRLLYALGEQLGNAAERPAWTEAGRAALEAARASR